MEGWVLKLFCRTSSSEQHINRYLLKLTQPNSITIERVPVFYGADGGLLQMCNLGGMH